ncbi:MAG: methyltransferase domain-containing protein [Elusimicrobia bacterium]|nr:methyltransferase domain-containing protein [Elusimicrobiota bacterium]
MNTFDPDAHTKQSRQTWSEAAPRYDKLSSSLFGPTAEAFAEFAGVRRGWRVLDVACGPGLAARAAAARAGETGRVLACDLAPGMIELAAARPPRARSAPIEWRVLDAENLDVPAGAFDAVLCQLGLMLFARPQRALEGMRRAAAPGAPVSCLVQGRRHAMRFTGLVFDAIVARAPELRAPSGAPTLFAFGPDGVLEEAFAMAGLTEIVTRRLSGTFRFESAEAYWNVMTEGSGRTRAMLETLKPEIQAKIKADVLRRAGKRRAGRGVEVAYEFVMARGLAPSRR